MDPLSAVIAIVAVFVLVGAWVAYADGLSFLAPKSTGRMLSSAQLFCSSRCREAGVCPLTRTTESAAECPLFKYVAADVPVVNYGNPFRTASL